MKRRVRRIKKEKERRRTAGETVTWIKRSREKEKEGERAEFCIHRAPKKETELILLFPHCNTEHGEKETRQKWRPENNKNQCLIRRKRKTRR